MNRRIVYPILALVLGGASALAVTTLHGAFTFLLGGRGNLTPIEMSAPTIECKSKGCRLEFGEAYSSERQSVVSGASAAMMAELFGEKVSYSFVSNLPKNSELRRDLGAIGRIDFLDEEGSKIGHCSGAAISETHVLTAGHCFYANGEWRGFAKAVFQLDLLWAPGTTIRADPDYLEPLVLKLDIPTTEALALDASLQSRWVVRYPKNTDPSRSTLDYAVLPFVDGEWGKAAARGKQPVTLAIPELYQGDELFIGHHAKGFEQVVSERGEKCLIASPTDAVQFLHNCDTQKGSSGAPVFSQNYRMVVALHVCCDLPTANDSVGYNFAVKIADIAVDSPQMFDDLIEKRPLTEEERQAVSLLRIAKVLSRQDATLREGLEIAMSVADTSLIERLPQNALSDLKLVIQRNSVLRKMFDGQLSIDVAEKSSQVLLSDGNQIERWVYDGERLNHRSYRNPLTPESLVGAPIAFDRNGSAVVLGHFEDGALGGFSVLDLEGGGEFTRISYEPPNYDLEDRAAFNYPSKMYADEQKTFSFRTFDYEGTAGISDSGDLVAFIVPERIKSRRRKTDDEEGTFIQPASDTIGVWNNKSKMLVGFGWISGHAISKIAFQSKTSNFAVGTNAGEVILFDGIKVSELSRINIRNTLEHAPGYASVEELHFNADGNELFVLFEDSSFAVISVGDDAGKKLKPIFIFSPVMPKAVVPRMTYTPQLSVCSGQQRFVTLGFQEARLWRPTKADQKRRPSAPFSRPAEIWTNVETPLSDRGFSWKALEMADPIRMIRCSADGEYVAVLAGNTVGLWSSSSGDQLFERSFGFGVSGASFFMSEDTLQLLVSGPQGHYLWRVLGGQPIERVWAVVDENPSKKISGTYLTSGPVMDLVLARAAQPSVLKGTWYRSGSAAPDLETLIDEALDSWRVDEAAIAEELGLAAIYNFDPYSDAFGLGNSDGMLVIDVLNKKIVQKFKGQGRIGAISFDGQFVATVEEVAEPELPRSIGIFNVSTGAQDVRLEGHESQINGLAFSKDGRHLYSYGLDGGLKYWTDWKSGDAGSTVALHTSAVRDMHVSCDAVLTSDGIIREWESETPRLVREFGPGYAPVFSSDCSLIAGINGNQVIVWSRATTAEIAKFVPHDEGNAYKVLFSGDDQYLVTLGQDRQPQRFPIGLMAWIQYGRELLYDSKIGEPN